MLSYSLKTIGSVVDATLFGSVETAINSVFIDSRIASIGSNSLFFALKGDNHDGHNFIEELYKKGVRGFVVSELKNFSELCPEATFLLVDSTLDALQQFAAFHRKKFSYPVIGITGSNGKTIVKEWLSQSLSIDKRIVRSPKSYNSQVGVPLSVLQMTNDFNLAIFEAGISLPNEMNKIEPIISPTIGIFTNIGMAHQENFDDFQSKAREKMRLFAHSQTLIYCNDFSLIESLAIEEASKRGIALFSWGKNEKADVRLLNQQIDISKSLLKINYQGGEFQLSVPYIDDASIENVMHCVCTMLYLGISVESIKNRVEKLQPVAMRLELKEGINGCTIINDSYNSDLGSLSIALDFLARQQQHPQRMLIISDILQSGQKPELLYREVASMAKAKGVDKVIGIGSSISTFPRFFPANSELYQNTDAFLSNFSRKKFANTAILLKGSRPFEFERISAVLEQKTHRTLMEINLNALTHNLSYFRNLIKPNVKVMAMVKAFSYGSGSHEIANLLQFHRVDYLGVAFADEGIALRQAGITLPIIVLNPAFGNYELMIDYDLEPEIFSLASLDSFTSVLAKFDVKDYPVHLKIDTGMHRLGFMQNEITDLKHRLQNLSYFRVQSIFSHLVATDDSNHDDYTRNQIDLFKSIGTELCQILGYQPMMHILNSAGIERFPNAQFDMVRLGIGLYGISATHQQNLQNVSTLKTYIAQLRELPQGETVGYNRKGKLYRPSKIATLPIGYADGLNRRLSNGLGWMLVKGTKAPVVGNVSMDTCMIDVTDVPSVAEGDEVIVFGESPSIMDISKSLETIPYEILTSISRRVKRVYIQE